MISLSWQIASTKRAVRYPALAGQGIADALLEVHLAGSDTEAIGGDLAYQYGVNRKFSGIGLVPAQNELANAQFGSVVQFLQSLAGLQMGSVRLG